MKLVEKTQKKSKFSQAKAIADKFALFGGEIVENLEIPAHSSCPNLPSKPPEILFEIVAGKPEQPISFQNKDITRPSNPDW